MGGGSEDWDEDGQYNNPPRTDDVAPLDFSYFAVYYSALQFARNVLKCTLEQAKQSKTMQSKAQQGNAKQ